MASFNSKYTGAEIEAKFDKLPNIEAKETEPENKDTLWLDMSESVDSTLYTKAECDDKFDKKTDVVELGTINGNTPIDPDKFYNLTTGASNISLNPAPADGKMHIYAFQLTATSDFTLNIIGVGWMCPNKCVAGKTYQVSIMNNLGVMAGEY